MNLNDSSIENDVVKKLIKRKKLLENIQTNFLLILEHIKICQ